MSDLDQLTQSLARNLKRWRTERGYTLDALAARSGVSRGMIIQIEQARTNPSVGTTVKLADALGISITTLLDYEQGPQVRVVPEEQAVRMWTTEAGSQAVLLVGTEKRGPLELWSWRLMPGEGSESDPHPRGTVEMLHVRSGVLTLLVDGARHQVPAGASASFESGVPHGYRNEGEEPMEMTLTVSVPPAG
ncbi:MULTISPECIES: helix-turn-helix domain-containing protein [Streptomyces]|uniref:Helix-turn-helix domain-containing protein n=2 Tax=Streptomyces TaxID=1883 RepID=A0ABX1H9A9_9ACTN|nr:MULTISPECIES: helix-turn-helix domain-containing protein [Streptomyces]AJE86987.1 putative transcriptional regulatory protein [Streptomyces albus]AOU81291.1 putative transcriptional regulatory protein [Streptomyces albus]AYN36984.1 XRE family transcriptional regulator [Streptomyces albus]NKI44927.1 helix-turn-helix domain-containing protein [Streptomyces physcomitrii]